MDNHLITLMIFFPFVGALVQALLPRRAVGRELFASRWVALTSSLAATVCGAILVFGLQSQAELQALESFTWIESYSISYDMGIDGLNILPVLLVICVFPLLIASQWNQRSGARGMFGLLLMLQCSLLGAVCSQDLFLLFFFWALSALPFYFLIGIWGGNDRESASSRFIVSSAVGNALLFAALVLIYYSVDPHTFSIRDLAGGKLEGRTFQFLGRDLQVSRVAFFLCAAGLALRAPVWPLHGWFTRVAEEAPPTVLVALSAVAVPSATYIFIRLSYSLFPETTAAFSPAIVTVGSVPLLIGALCALAPRGVRRLLAYVCLSGIGMILVGIGSLSSAGVVGAIYLGLSLGLGIAGFGLIAGIIADRGGTTRFADEEGKSMLGGIAAKAPALALATAVVLASLLGFPGFSGFVGSSLLLIGSYPSNPAAVILAGLGILLATYYLFTMYRLVFLGKGGSDAFMDLTLRERAYLFPLMALLLAFGVYPKPLIELVRPTVQALLTTIK